MAKMLGRGLRGRLGSFAARGGQPTAAPGQHTARVGRNATTTAATGGTGGTGELRATPQQHAIGDGGGGGPPKSASTFPTAVGHYPHLERIQTRWNDHDAFGHINNVQFYQYFDDAVNAHLLRSGIGMEHKRFVAQSGCRYLRPIVGGSGIDVGIGLRVVNLGRSSVTYELGVFDDGARCATADGGGGGGSGSLALSDAPFPATAAAVGTFVHVYVDEDGQPTPIAPHIRALLASLQPAPM